MKCVTTKFFLKLLNFEQKDVSERTLENGHNMGPIVAMAADKTEKYEYQSSSTKCEGSSHSFLRFQ